MENENIAIISVPRTASRSLTKHFSKMTGKPVALGTLAVPEFLGPRADEELVRSLVKNKTHVLHGHWHTLDQLSPDILDIIRNEYTIFTSYRDEMLVRESLYKIDPSITEEKVTDLFAGSELERAKWNVAKSYVLDEENVNEVTERPNGFV